MQAGLLSMPGPASWSNPAMPATPADAGYAGSYAAGPGAGRACWVGVLGGMLARHRRFEGSVAKLECSPALPASMPTSMTGTPSMPSRPDMAWHGMARSSKSACPCRHPARAQAPPIPACPRACPPFRTQAGQSGDANPLHPRGSPPLLRHQQPTSRYRTIRLLRQCRQGWRHQTAPSAR